MAAATFFGVATGAGAASDIAQQPLISSTAGEPNVMLMMDDSNSMLGTVLRHRSVGDITAADLPDRYRVSPRRRDLGPLERAEHDAIVAALAAADGNKARAAAALGISRTTLYSRLRSLRIG